MICRSCRRSLLAQARFLYRRGVATAPATSSSSHPPLSPTESKAPVNPAPSPSISQPLSSPPSAKFGPAGATEDTAKSNTAKLQGSVPGGAELRGLAYLKAQPHVWAKEDDEYPTWLWTILDEPKTTTGVPAVDLAAMTKKQRAKYDRRQERLMKDVPVPIPVHEQSRDLTSATDGATVSLQKRQEVTKSSREARRKGIRENNFLRGM